MFTGFQGSDAVCNHGDGIVAAECKVVLYTAPSDEQLQAQNFTCDTSGLLCSDADNSYGCHDYAVRYHCITPGNTLTTLYAVTCKDSKHKLYNINIDIRLLSSKIFKNYRPHDKFALNHTSFELLAKNVADFCVIESRDLGVDTALNYGEAVDLCSAFNMTLPKLRQREDMIYVSQNL